MPTAMSSKSSPTSSFHSADGRKFNFSAGPGAMPEEVLKQIQEDVWDCRHTGVGILEHSHRAKTYDAILAEAEQDFRDIGNIPANYRVLFMTGGSTAQNFQIPMNFLPADRSGTADYVNSGYWAQRSIDDAQIFGHIHEAGSGKAGNYTHLPTQEELKFSSKPVYLHYTSNNTIFGTQYHTVLKPPAGTELVCDMCSDIYSRPFDVRKFGLIYASAQKNLGPAGVTVVIVRDDLVQRGRTDIPHMLQYRTFASTESRPNTPPVFPIYCVGLMAKWIKKHAGGGAAGQTALEYFASYNAKKAKVVYDTIDGSGGFYRGHAQAKDRSLMNILFFTPSKELDDRFVTEAAQAGLDCLRGHRSSGGMRASLYNAMPIAGAEALAQFMREFARRNG